MKILFINLPYYGHVVPTIGLVQELIKQGCEVTYLMPFDWEEKIAESGIYFLRHGVKRCSFLFQNCVDVFASENVDVIISVGPKFDIRKLKNIPDNIHIYKSVSQIAVLKMADVFVAHGGMNSVSEALAYGVPMVVVPFVSDRPVNAQFVEKLGVGKKLEYTALDKNTLKDTVLSMITDEKVKDNLNRVQNLIQAAPGNKGGAEMVISWSHLQ